MRMNSLWNLGWRCVALTAGRNIFIGGSIFGFGIFRDVSKSTIASPTRNSCSSFSDVISIASNTRDVMQ